MTILYQGWLLTPLPLPVWLLQEIQNVIPYILYLLKKNSILEFPSTKQLIFVRIVQMKHTFNQWIAVMTADFMVKYVLFYYL